MGGGILIYAKNGIKLVPMDSSSSFYQHCSFQVLTTSDKLNFVLIYRPPSMGAENTDLLCDLLENTRPNTFVIGDFNLPGVNW